MRIVHLCSMDFSGAGKAAYRLHKGLQEIGVDSSMVVMCKKTSDDSVYALPSEVSNSPAKWWGLLTNIWERSLANYPLRSADNELFSEFYAAISLGPLQEIIHSADIINLHWVAGFFNASLMPSSLLNKKIVWTLHDMNPFTGGCHYAGECIRYHDSCGACPQLASDDPKDLSFSGWTLKQQGYRALDITVVTPSRWLGMCSEKSSLLGRFSHKIIPYGFPLNTFKPLDRQSIRSALNIPSDAQIVLFCADSTATKRKGFSYLLDALAQLFESGRGKDLTLAVVGSYDSNRQDACAYPVLSFGHISDEEQMALLYNAADVFVLPSLEDNLPNTVVEALACGTPVAAFNIGGVPDMVNHGITGYLAPAKNVAGLADAIEWCVNYAPAEIRHSCRAKSERYFALETQANNYKKLYDSITAKAENQMPGVFIKKTAPKISIVTPSFNQAEYLEECIDSILSQNYPNLEYIIMDGGSTDGSVEIIKKYEKYLTYWQSKPDGGQYHAINEGFRRSTGEIMAWLNSDDKYHPGALHLAEMAFRAMPQVEWITGRPTAWDAEGNVSIVFDHVPEWSLERILYHDKNDFYIQQESTFWRRSLWDKAGGMLDTSWRLAADFELWRRFFGYARLVGVDALLGGFRYHSAQKTNLLKERYEQEVLGIIAGDYPVMQEAPSQRPPTISMDTIIAATGPELTPEVFSYFSYSRRPHFSWFDRSAKRLFGSSIDMDYCDLKMYQDLICYTFITDNIPRGSRILEIGGGQSRVLKAIASDYECWNIDKLEGLGNGPTELHPDGYRLVRAYMGESSAELSSQYFDFIFSISALEHVEESEDNFRNICDDIDRVMKPEAFSLHCFDVVAKENTWTNQLLPYLFRRYETINRFTPFEQMRQDPFLYYMPEETYNRSWINITKQSYRDFGQPLSYNVLWQKQLNEIPAVLPDRENQPQAAVSAPRVTVATHITTDNIAGQKSALATWMDLGIKIISVNQPEEIAVLRHDFPEVSFVEAVQSQYAQNGCYLDDLLQALAKSESELCGIIPSGTSLNNDNELFLTILAASRGSIAFGSFDAPGTAAESENVSPGGLCKYLFFSKAAIAVVPPSDARFGDTTWDFWLVVAAILHDYSTFWVTDNFATPGTTSNRHENLLEMQCVELLNRFARLSQNPARALELVRLLQPFAFAENFGTFFELLGGYAKLHSMVNVHQEGSNFLCNLESELKFAAKTYMENSGEGVSKEDLQRLDSAAKDPVQFLLRLSGPLFADCETGKLVREMISAPVGRFIRLALPRYNPYCLFYFPQMMLNILSDGSVTTCCFDPLGKNGFASIYEKDLAAIWAEDVPRVMCGDFYENMGCIPCFGCENRSSLINEPGKKEEWLRLTDAAPNEIQLEITANCNYSCVSCNSKIIRELRSADLDLEVTFKNIRSMLKKVRKLNLYNYGEPLLHKGFSDFIQKCRAESDDLILELATNGMLLNESISRAIIENRVNRIIISAHGGPGTENMLKYSTHGADYEKLLANIRMLIRLREEYRSELPKISLRAILFEWNDNDEDTDRLRNDARKLGLSATHGQYDTDNYHWILDGATKHASKKYVRGSAALQGLIDAKEF
ncbi:MAG: glycosyltransferase [Deltaproteobacteria bacterium]|nr:glycosyltransferase [Deltaproteobacteria bacterium]